MSRMFLATIAVLFAELSAGQGTYQYTVGDATAPDGGYYTQDVSLTVNSDPTVSGWAVAVCHDSSVSDVCGASIHPDVFTINPSPFFAVTAWDDRATVVPGSVDGIRTAVVLDQGGILLFPSDQTRGVLVGHYLADPGTSGQTSTSFVCDAAVGDPLTEVIVVCCGGNSLPFSAPAVTAVSGTVTHGPPVPLWEFSGAAQSVHYDSTQGTCLSNCDLAVQIEIANTPANTELFNTTGLTISLTHDPTLLTATLVELGSTLASIQQAAVPVLDPLDCDDTTGSVGPDIVQTNVTPNGVSILIQNTQFPAMVPYCARYVDWGDGDIAVTIHYAADASTLAGNSIGTSTTLTFEDIGDGVGNSLSVQCVAPLQPQMHALTAPENVAAQDILINFFSVCDQLALRGDCNDDGTFNIADPIWIIGGYLMTPPVNPPGGCPVACDVNGDDSIDVADVAYSLMYFFVGGSPPAPPFPQCGSVDCSNCPSFSNCP